MFDFKLQNLLDVRIILEDKSAMDFSAQQKVLQKEKDDLQAIQEQKMELMDTLRGIQGKTVNVSEITFNSSSMEQYRKYEDVQEERVRQATAESNKKKVELLEASKKRKAMEILKAKMLAKYQSDSGMRERAAIDEMAIVRHKGRREE